MGRRSVLTAYQFWNNADSSVSPSGPTTNCEGLDYITYKIRCASTVVAELAVFINTADDNNNGFIALDFGEQIILNGASETEYVIEIRNSGFKYINIEFLDSTGTGTISGWISGLTVGA
jgi:hypothetical protein